MKRIKSRINGFYLNGVGYKVTPLVCIPEGVARFYLNGVGYKGLNALFIKKRLICFI